MFIFKKILFFVSLVALPGCHSFLYYPHHKKYADPSQLKPSPTNWWISVASGETVHAWFFSPSAKPENWKGVIVHCHGNAENLTTHFRGMDWIVDEGYAYVIFDYEGYGESSGHPSPRHTVEDAIAVVEETHRRYPEVPLILFGQSLGGTVALRAAIELKQLTIPLFAVAVEGTFPSYKRMARAALSRSWMTWIFQPLGWLFMSDRYSPDKRIDEISPIPLLVMHGEKDRIIPLEQGKAIYDQAREPKEFWPVPGAGHLQVFWTEKEEYRVKFLKWLQSLR